MPPQYIYQMADLHKFYDKKEVLKGIWLGFYPGAKIGVLGVNGSGKSTLLRIMAGVDKDFDGEAGRTARPPSASCRRNRSSIPTRDVLGNSKKPSRPCARC